ncbi:DUF3298 and DUF4163 domain-containing protein [Clostridium sp. HBUAS56010]|uniref:DUF3298 and DUF4163 domain-containing protein n=1 Tax=Clostridium sp. HBUAS56010 TaxID=2571127 RepID=UPI001177D6D8|nr:DUF3298 and DUF4163 domain-containing protein [Clostridium sp. HBUAS56010]
MEDNKNHNLVNMQDKYQDIPVPEAAREAVLMGINRGKKEKRKANVIKGFKKTGVTAAAAAAIITVMANVSPDAASAMEKIPVLGAITRVVTFRTYEDRKDHYEAKIQVPKVAMENNDTTNVNVSIEAYANKLIKEYERQVTEGLAGKGHYLVNSGYEVVTDNEKYLSLRINTTVIMASGTQYVKIFTINKATGNVVTLHGLLGEEKEAMDRISENIRKQMADQMAADDSKTYFYQKEGDNTEEGFQGITGEESYYFNGKGEIVIVFDEYEVAPGYMGAVEFTIPKSVTGI